MHIHINIYIYLYMYFFGFMQLMIVIFWIPGIAPAILAKVSNVDQEIIRDAIIVLHVFSFFPIPGMYVTFISHFHSI